MNDLLGQAVKLKEAQVRDSRAKWYALPRAIRETVYRCMPTSLVAPPSTSSSSTEKHQQQQKSLLRYVSDQNLISSVIEKKCSFLLHSSSATTTKQEDRVDDDDESLPKIEFSSDLEKCLAHSQSIFQQATKAQQQHQKFREARELYIDALSVFCFVLPTKQDWNKKGF